MNLKVQSEKLPGSIARLEIEVEDERVGREMERAYKRLANRVVVPGFRRGKAPRVLVERMLGEGALLEEAAKELVPDAIANALEQENLEPVGEPESYNQLETEPFRFEVTVPIVPTVTVGDYQSVRAERQPVSVSDEEVEEVIERLRDREAVWTTPDPPRPAQKGDQLEINIQDFAKDEPLGDPQEDVTITLGEGSLLGELEDQMVGVEEGKEYEFAATMPEDHEREDLAGQSVTFKVKVNAVREKQMPELDDEFAKRVGEDVETLDDLRTRVRGNLEARKSSEERDRLVSSVVDQIVAGSTVDVPDVLVNREAAHRLRHLAAEFESQGITLDQFVAITGRSVEDLLQEMREPARERLIRGLVLNEVAKAEQITVDDAEIEQQAVQLMEGISESELPNVREMLSSDDWRERLRTQAYDRKVLNRIVEIATGEPLDAPITDAEDESMRESDFEINEMLDDMEADSAATQVLEESPAEAETVETDAQAEETDSATQPA